MIRPAAKQWDVFCRVVDNLGDAGVCWRLAADLAARGQQVRLVIDDTAPLAVLAPDAAAGVVVEQWPGSTRVGDIVVEAFGCDPPAAFVAAMQPKRPCWLNLEYLSAEPWVERSHGLPSPQPGGLVKHFFFPGFTPRTGGLLREPGLLAARQAFDRGPWLAAHGIAPLPGERLVSLFCYDNPRVPALLDSLAAAPTLLLLTPGYAQQQVVSAPSGVRLQRLPWLTQVDYDRLLWACDLNVVRGEDSLVRALWAGAPFVWQAYPQADRAHAAKVEALLALLQLPAGVEQLWRAWNGGETGWPDLPDLAVWQRAAAPFRQRLLLQADLTSRLLEWAGC